MNLNRIVGQVKANLPWLIAILFLGLLPFSGFLFSGKLLFASDQMASPSWKFLFDALRHGELPLWSPLSLAGLPTYDALAGDANYPPFLLLGLLLPIQKVIGYNFVLHCLLAGLFAFVLLRGYFKLDRFLAVALSVAYMLNTNYISLIYSGHTGKFYVLTWLPLGLFFLLKSLDGRARWFHLVGLALTVAAMVTTSHLQLTYFVLMGYFCYFAFKVGVALKAKQNRTAGSIAIKFWIPILLGIGLCFPLFYAPLKYNQDFSVRGEGQRQTYEHATSWSMHPEETASLIVPEFGGINEKYWGRNPFKLNSEYPGIAVWVLALFGLFAFRRGFFFLWTTVCLLAIVYGLGAETPLFHLFYSFIPGVKSFRAPSMILFWLAAGLLVMSAYTLRLLTVERNSLIGHKSDFALWGKRVALITGILGGTIIAAGLLRSVTYGIWNGIFSAENIPNIARQSMAESAFTGGALRAGILILVLGWAIRKWLLRDVNERYFAALLLGVTLVDQYWVNSHFIETYEFDRAFAHERAIDELKADTSAYRTYALPGSVPKGYLQYHGIAWTDGWIDQEYRLYRAYRGVDYSQNPNFMAGLHQNSDGTVSGSRFLDMLNVKYLLFRTPQAPGLQFTRNESALPRAWFVESWKLLPADKQLDAMLASDFDPRQLVLLDNADGLPNRNAPLDSIGTSETVAVIHRDTYRNNFLKYTVKNRKEGILVISESWFPYWRMRVDGKPQDILRANYLFRGVHLQPGEHQIEMEYVSEPLRKSLLVSLVALISILAFSFLAARFGRKDETGPSSKDGASVTGMEV